MKEDKQKILDKLLPALQATRALYDLEKLTFVGGIEEQYVVGTFASGYMKKVDVTMDSGRAMILDIVRWLV